MPRGWRDSDSCKLQLRRAGGYFRPERSRGQSLRADEVVRESMGEHLYKNFFEAKTREYDGYRQHVSDWERDKYMLQY